MFRSTRLGAISVLIAMLSVLLAACGGSSAETPAAPAATTVPAAAQPTTAAPAAAEATAAPTAAAAAEATAAPTAAAEATTAPTAASAAAGPTAAPAAGGEAATITWAFWGDPSEVAINQSVLQEFTKVHPEIKVNVRNEPWSNYFNTVTPSLNTDDAPDVLFLFDIPNYAKDGVLEDLTPYIEKSNYNTQDYWQPLLDTFRYEGKIYGFPRDNDTNVLYYNKKILSEAGVQPPTDKWTWDDFRSALEKTTKKEGDRTARYGLAMESGKWAYWLWQTGTNIVDNKDNPTKGNLDSPKAMEAVKFFSDLIRGGYVLTGKGLDNAGGDAGAFTSGQATFIIQNASRIPTFNSTPDLDYALAPLPLPKDGKRANATGGAGYVMSSKSKNKEAAWTFLSWLQSKEGGQSLFAKAGGMVPALQSVANSPALLEGKPEGKQALVLETQNPARTDGSFPEWNELNSQVITPELDKIWVGDATPEQELPVLNDAINKFLKDNGYPK